MLLHLHLTPAEQLNLTEQRSYTKMHLTDIGSSILKLSTNSDFKEVLYTEVAKQFDGDNDVLIITLIDELAKVNSELAINLRQVEPSLNKFKNIEGENYYPQIFIPNFEQLGHKNYANGRVRESNDPPVMVFYNGDETIEELPGYTIGNDGSIVKLGIQVDEAYANEHEVWVISINERVNSDGEISESNFNNTRVSENGRVMMNEDAVIDDIWVYCDKESGFLSGKSEINMLTILSNWGFSSTHLRKYGGSKYKGGQLDQVSAFLMQPRGSGTSPAQISVDFVVQDDWVSKHPGLDYANIVIFEYDPWPTGKRTATFIHDNNTKTKKYRSSHVFYHSEPLFRTWFSGAFSLPCLDWTGSYQ